MDICLRFLEWCFDVRWWPVSSRTKKDIVRIRDLSFCVVGVRV